MNTCIYPCDRSLIAAAVDLLPSETVFATFVGRKVCKAWKRGLDTMVSKLRVGPHNREPHVWNRQLLMMRRLQHLFPCLQEIEFDQVS